MKDSTAPRLRFFGATDSVAGSRFLLESEGRRVLVAESTYGNRVHPAGNPEDILADAVRLPGRGHPRSRLGRHGV
jgi:hypothetical protein